MNVTIIDNFLEEDKFKSISDLMPYQISWHYYDHAVYDIDDDSSLNLFKNRKDLLGITKDLDNNSHCQFNHVLYESSNWAYYKAEELLQPILEKLVFNTLSRIKINMTLPTVNPTVGGWHTDNRTNGSSAITSIYYVNSNNGYTLFEDGTRVDSKANRLVSFPTNMPHTG